MNDTAGNENSSSVTFTVDTTGPTVSIESPTNDSNSSDTGLNVNYTTTDTLLELDSCWYSNDSMSENVTLSDCSTNITDVTWVEGMHNVQEDHLIWTNDAVREIVRMRRAARAGDTIHSLDFLRP